MRPMDGYIRRVKAAVESKDNLTLELIIQEIYETGFDKGKGLSRDLF